MKRTTVDFGIDLGTTNSAISKMHKGNAISIRTQTLKDTMPSCVYINRRKVIQVGDAAFNALKNEKLKASKNWDNSKDNSFIEFKRTMGSDANYYSSNAEKSFSSIELSAEVLKTLKSFEKDENINAVVITVPAAFKSNQIDETRKAGKAAGFKQVEIITEPEAAVWGYGIDGDKEDGYWLVFDFGGGTFDAALVEVSDGIRQVIDTEGDNYLGGKNLDEAIVDKIIIPYLQENFVIDELLDNNNRSKILRSAMKFYAEEIKKQLSFNTETSILTGIGDIPGEDDEGEEFELDFSITERELEAVLGPIFQKAIDISIELLNRRNLGGAKLSSLILVGGPTYSPILRRMLEDQICKPDTSVDPMTVVSKGAAIYASTIKKADDTVTIDYSKIQLELDFEAASIEMDEHVVIKILKDKTVGNIPNEVYADITRDDGDWSSGKTAINETGEIITVDLREKRLNSFSISLYDNLGSLLECEPASFNIIQGSKGGSAVLPYNVGIEIQDINTGKLKFKTVEGMEKSKQLPAVGIMNNLKTPKQIRPGMDVDFLEISIYQGEHGAEGSRAIHNHHVSTIYITGSDFPTLLPANSDVDITVNIDINQKITGKAYFQYLDFEYEFECNPVIDAINSSKVAWLENEIKKAENDIRELRSKGITNDELNKADKDLQEIESQFNRDKNAADNQQQTIENLRKTLKVVDKLIGEREWPELEKELKDAFYQLEKTNKEKGNEQTTPIVEKLRPDVEQAIREQDMKNTPRLIEMINTLGFELERLEHLIGFIIIHDREFNTINWKDSRTARSVIERGKNIIVNAPSIESIQPIVNDLYDNAGYGEGHPPKGNVPEGILRG
jgi:molecular chaperone DnaK